MVDHFVALPVGQGDAFFLKRGRFTVLVDGGRSVRAFAPMFCQLLNRKSVAALVCTHNDADHANGILGFLESGLACEEVWLPALWADRLDDLLLRPGEFLEELIGDINQLQKRRRDHDESKDLPQLDRLGDRLSGDQGDERPANEVTVKGSGTSPVSKAMPPIEIVDDGNEERDWVGFQNDRDLTITILQPGVWTFRDESRGQLLFQALAAAERIRAIALACTHRSVPVRWFQHSRTHAKGGNPGLLTPLNAVEVARTGPRRIAALHYLALSTANRLSLTFCSQPSHKYPGVVFTADSDLQYSVPIPWRVGMIVTAPHHGSEANAPAYGRFVRDTKGKFDVIWVRSDGHFKSRPGSSYLKQPKRYCTLCRGVNRQKKSVRFAPSNGHWVPTGNRRCSCR